MTQSESDAIRIALAKLRNSEAALFYGDTDRAGEELQVAIQIINEVLIASVKERPNS